MTIKTKRRFLSLFHYTLVAFAIVLITGPFIVLGQSWSASRAELDHYRLEEAEKRLADGQTTLQTIQTKMDSFSRQLDIINYEIKAAGADTLWHQMSSGGVGVLLLERAVRLVAQQRQKNVERNEEPS